MAEGFGTLLTPPRREGFAPLSPVGFAPQEEEKGILGTILTELGKDLKGTAKIATATAFAPFDIAGLNVPVSFDDITKRDLLGGASVASMFAGGAAVQALRVGAATRTGVAGARALSATELVKKIPTWQAIATAAAGEASAGALFGAIKPLEQSESRLQEIVEETFLFGALGGVGGVVGAGWRATIGNRLADIKRVKGQAILGQAFQREQAKVGLQEYAGLKFRHSDGSVAVVQRELDNRVSVINVTTGEFMGAASSTEFSKGIQTVVKNGFEEFVGPAKTQFTMDELADVTSKFGDISGETKIQDVLDEVRATNYKAYVDAISLKAQAKSLQDLSLLDKIRPYVDDTEALPPQTVKTLLNDVWGALPPNMRTEELKIGKRLLENGNDPGGSTFLKAALEIGAIRIESLNEAFNQEKLWKELLLNDRVPKGIANVYAVGGTADATLLDLVVTGSGIMRLHPEVAPIWNKFSKASRRVDLGSVEAKRWLREFPNKFKKETMRDALRLYGQAGANLQEFERLYTAAGGDLSLAGKELKSFFGFYQLREIGRGIDLNFTKEFDKGAVATTLDLIDNHLDDRFEHKVTAALNLAEELNILRGQLTKGQLEIFDDLWQNKIAKPFNVNSPVTGYGVQIENGPVQHFATYNEAMRVALASNKNAKVQPSISITDEIFRVAPLSKLKNYVQRMTDEQGVSVTPRLRQQLGLDKKTIEELFDETNGDVLQAINKIATESQKGFLKPKLQFALEAFSEDPFENLEFFALGKESSIAFFPLGGRAFEQEIANSIAPNKEALKQLILRKRDLLTGRESWEEKLTNNFFAQFAPEVSKLSLKKFSSYIRRGQGVFKLGGVWSGLVNSTQYLTNSYAVLGHKYATKGLEVFFDSEKRADFMKFIKSEKLDLGFHDAISGENSALVSEEILPFVRSAIARRKLGNNAEARKAMLNAAENTWMLAFNGAERMNRMATAYGAYHKYIDNITSQGSNVTKTVKSDAAQFALGKVRQTQFSYRSDNIPMLMQGPIGSVLFQFKSFFVNQVEFMTSLSPEEQRRFLGAMVALGGTSSILDIPGVDIADNLSQFVFDAKLSEASKVAELEYFDSEDSSSVTKSLMRFGLYGAPGLTGADLSNYIGPGSIMDLTRGLLGPTVSDSKSFLEFAQKAISDVNVTGSVQPETVEKLALQLMPSQLRRIRNGSKIIDTGDVRSSYTGKLLYRPEHRYWEGFGAMLGGSTIRTETARALDEYVARQSRDYSNTRTSFRKEIALALIGNNPRQAQTLQERARQSGIIFTPGDLKRAVDDFSKDAKQRRLERTPAAVREQTIFDLQSLNNF